MLKVLQCDVIHREKANGGVVLRAHVGNGGPVSGRELRDPRAKELHKFARDACLAKVLGRK